MPRSTPWSWRLGAVRPCRLVSLALLAAAGCFEIDDHGEDALDHLPWNPPPLTQTAPGPVIAADATVGAPPVGQDAALGQDATRPPAAAPILDAAVDSSVQASGPGPGGDPFAPNGSAGDGSVDVSDSGLPPQARPTTLSFSVLTKSLGGRYAPRNIGAIWIENSSGKWMKTLAVWAFIRERYLTRFRAASGGNRVDAVTSATLTRHTTHSVTWNLTDATGVPVPDGDYRVVVETTDRDATGDSTEVPFTKGPFSVRTMPPDATHYVDMSLALE